MIKLFTIGCSGRSARDFFGALGKAQIQTVIDIRLRNTSHLAGFSKMQDLPFFLESICGAAYIHIPQLAPTERILDDFKKNKGSWDEYETAYLRLLEERGAEDLLSPAFLHMGCLLCSETKSDYCHRRLASDYFARKFSEVSITHL
ncbi:MAG TPA: DUF488 domain-containing protein [Synergistales bacterium]|nr:DUF488 domain-containing protein [Synergistales bacterium]